MDSSLIIKMGHFAWPDLDADPHGFKDAVSRDVGWLSLDSRLSAFNVCGPFSISLMLLKNFLVFNFTLLAGILLARFRLFHQIT
jgi:hypothetical protein